MERNNEVHSVISHCSEKLFIIEGNKDRTHILGVAVTELHSFSNRHTFHIIEDELAVLIHTLGNQGEVDLQPSITQCPCEVRHLGVCLARQTNSGHIHDDLHGVDEMNDFKVREALEANATIEVLLFHIVISLELVEDLALVLRVELVQLRLLLRCEEVLIPILQSAVVIPEVFVLLVAFRVVDSHPLDTIRGVNISHVRLPRIRVILLVKAKEFLGELTHVCSGAFHITQTTTYLKVCLLHAVADVKDLVCRQSGVRQSLLNSSKCAGQQSSLLAQSGEVKTTAVLHIANERCSAGAGEIVESASVLCDHLGNTVDRVDVVLCLLLGHANCLGDFLGRLVSFLHIVRLLPCVFRFKRNSRCHRFGLCIQLKANLLCRLEIVTRFHQCLCEHILELFKDFLHLHESFGFMEQRLVLSVHLEEPLDELTNTLKDLVTKRLVKLPDLCNPIHDLAVFQHTVESVCNYLVIGLTVGNFRTVTDFLQTSLLFQHQLMHRNAIFAVGLYKEICHSLVLLQTPGLDEVSQLMGQRIQCQALCAAVSVQVDADLTVCRHVNTGVGSFLLALIVEEYLQRVTILVLEGLGKVGGEELVVCADSHLVQDLCCFKTTTLLFFQLAQLFRC